MTYSLTYVTGWVLRQQLWSAVIDINELVKARETHGPNSTVTPPTRSPAPHMETVPIKPLPYCEDWSSLQCGQNRIPHSWGSVFISERVLITRSELLQLLCIKLEMQSTRLNHMKLVKGLTVQCYGCARVGDHRTFVGITCTSQPRRDYVQVRGSENNTCLALQVIMFVKVSGFSRDGTILPHFLRSPPSNDHRVSLALVRWLSPHPLALLRDSEKRPVCTSPFDINHALWTFSRQERERTVLGVKVFKPSTLEKQGHLLTGQDVDQLRFAMYDLIRPETFERYMNCTIVDGDTSKIMETITLPFNFRK